MNQTLLYCLLVSAAAAACEKAPTGLGDKIRAVYKSKQTIGTHVSGPIIEINDVPYWVERINPTGEDDFDRHHAERKVGILTFDHNSNYFYKSINCFIVGNMYVVSGEKFYEILKLENFNKSYKDSLYKKYKGFDINDLESVLNLMLAMVQPVLFAHSIDFMFCDLEMGSFVNTSPDKYDSLKIAQVSRLSPVSKIPCKPVNNGYTYVFLPSKGNTQYDKDMLTKSDVFSLGIIFANIFIESVKIEAERSKDFEKTNLSLMTIQELEKFGKNYNDHTLSISWAYKELINLIKDMTIGYVNKRPNTKKVSRKLAALRALVIHGKEVEEEVAPLKKDIKKYDDELKKKDFSTDIFEKTYEATTAHAETIHIESLNVKKFIEKLKALPLKTSLPQQKKVIV